jgi:hypothetical protein
LPPIALERSAFALAQPSSVRRLSVKAALVVTIGLLLRFLAIDTAAPDQFRHFDQGDDTSKST